MVAVPLRHKAAVGPFARLGGLRPAIATRSWLPWALAVSFGTIAIAAVWLTESAGQQGALDLVSDRTPVALTVAGHGLIVPANMLRSAALRRGGPFEQVDLALHWPDLDGYSDRTADFMTGNPRAPIVYATISRQMAPLDATARLDTVYVRFFTGKPVAGPAGLVGRRLSAQSGFGGEIVYFVPAAPQPFVARCIATETPEVPSTCLRDINFGGDLTILFRFDRNLLGQWQPLEAGMRRLANTILVR